MASHLLRTVTKNLGMDASQYPQKNQRDPGLLQHEPSRF